MSNQARFRLLDRQVDSMDNREVDHPQSAPASERASVQVQDSLQVRQESAQPADALLLLNNKPHAITKLS